MDIFYVAITVSAVVLLVLVLNKRRNAPARSSSTQQDIVSAIKDGNMIEAIKHYRHVHGCTLKEAKIAIKAMQDKAWESNGLSGICAVKFEALIIARNIPNIKTFSALFFFFQVLH